jgi:formiminoglutamase
MKSNNGNFGFIDWDTDANADYTMLLSKRDGESRIGECLSPLKEAQFVILGVEESIGPKTNKGRSGAENGFRAFCSKFLNMQQNEFVASKKIAFLGRILALEDDLLGTEYVSELDDFLIEVLTFNVQPHQHVILVGGGHNNAYPLIRFYAQSIGHSGDVINLDPHADYRATEGRHSGNPFSYAFNEGLLNKYVVFGLHAAYNNQFMLDQLKKHNHAIYQFENWIDDSTVFESDLKDALQKIEANHFLGLELDLDAIEGMPASAITPSGVSIQQARKFIRVIAAIQQKGYLHLPEGAPQTAEQYDLVGKALAYFVHDYITCYRN